MCIRGIEKETDLYENVTFTEIIFRFTEIIPLVLNLGFPLSAVFLPHVYSSMPSQIGIFKGCIII